MGVREMKNEKQKSTKEKKRISLERYTEKMYIVLRLFQRNRRLRGFKVDTNIDLAI